jgi:hypothetical protein
MGKKCIQNVGGENRERPAGKQSVDMRIKVKTILEKYVLNL